MRNRIKRTLALLLALLLFAGTLFTDGLQMIRAEERLKNVVVSIPRENMSSLSGFVSGVPLDNLRVSVDVKKVPDTFNVQATISADQSTFQVPYDTGYSYSYRFDSDNYRIIASGDITDSAEDSTVNVTSVIPKYSIQSISGDSSITLGEEKSYTANINETAWSEYVTWSLLRAEGQDVTLTQNGGSCSLRVNALNAETVNVTLRATDKNGEYKDYPITLNRKKFDLAITPSGTWNNINVSVATNPAVANKSITLSGAGFTSQTASTDASGVANFTTSVATAGTQYDFTASFAGDADYKTVSKTYTGFSPGLLDQSFSIKRTETVVTYGQKDVVVAELTSTGGVQPATYTASVDDGNGAVTVDNSTGKVKYTPAKSGEVTISIYKNGNADYNQTPVQTITVNVNKKEVEIDSTTVAAVNKTYDGNTAVTVSGKVTSNLAEGDTAFDVSTDAGVAEKKDAGIGINVNASLSIVDSAMDEKYSLKDSGRVSTTVDIFPKKLGFTVGNAEVAYDAIDVNQLTFVGEKITYNTADFVGDENNTNLANFENPQIEIDMSLISATSSLDTPIANVLKIKADTGNPSNNYVFDIDNYTKGSLTLREETLTSREYADYVEVDNGASSRVYQVGDKFYYGVKTDRNPVAKFSFKETKYDALEIYNASTDDYSPVPLTGIEMDADSPSQTLKLRLVKNGEHGRTSPFEITFLRDNTSPEATVTIGEASIPFMEYAESITFGLFKNERVDANVVVNDPEETDVPSAGISSWGYYVFNPTESDTALTDATVRSFPYTNVLSGNVTIPLGNTEQAQNYVIFVLMTDNVGNTAIVGTNGIIIENIQMNEILLSYKEGTTFANETDYFSDDANLDITVTENTQTKYSGVKQIDYTVTKDGSTGDVVHLYAKDTPNEVTLAELKADTDSKEDYSKVEKSITVGKESGSKRVTVNVTALDFAGNTSNPIQSTKSFVIDPVKPVITQHAITSGTSKYNNSYYNTDVTITTKIKERFLDSEDASFTIVKDGVSQTVSIKELNESAALRESLGLKEEQGFSYTLTDEASDNSETTVILVFEKNGVYSVNVNAKDKSGNLTDAVGGISFTVDKVAPQAKMIYYSYGTGETFTSGTEKNAPTYLGEKFNSFDAVLQVIEKNFSDGLSVNGTYTLTAKDSDDENVTSDTVNTYMNQAKVYGKWINDGIGEDTHEYSLNFATDANYSFGFSYEDLAGNPVSVSTEYVTLDKTKPNGSVIVNGLVNGEPQKSWLNYFLSGITFGLFGNTSANATMTSDDDTAGVKSTQYLVTDTYFTKDQAAARTDWTTYERAIGLAANRNVIVYQKVVDRADNTEYYSSDSFVMDNVDPAPVVTITPSSPAWGKGVYSANDNPGFNINVTDPIVNNAYSGLKEITYKIVNGTTGVVETGTLATIGKSAHQQTWTGHVNIDPNKFYSNDVQVTVTASDWSTNDATSETAKLKIDNKAPIVKFSFDKSDVQNGKYYKNNKTLTITVDERNFDKSYTPKVTSTAGGGYSFSGWSTNGEISTGTVTFSGDSDYTVTFDCYDLAGNKSNTEKLEEFTVDKTNPTISVSYDNNSAQNGNYYKATRTATITITEHNFRAGDVRVTTTASNGSAPGVSGWSTSGDRHTATVHFGSDADYTFDISYVDLAGNASADYAQDKFTVDLTKPSLEIAGVQNKSANKGTVAPIIKISDTNFIANGVTLTLTGANKGKVNTSNMITTASAPNGETITFLNFGSGMDDIYTLTAKAVDKAGNDTTQSITFSVNRDGSTYVINDSTKKLLEKGFTNNPQDIVIQEINVDTLEFVELSYSKDGKIVKLTEGKDFKVAEEGAEGQWKKYTYTVFADCFDEEGEYSINISSTDRAENVNNNKVQAVNVDFVVDKTSPVMAVSNLENRGRYKENSHEYTLNVKDNTSLVSVAIYLDDELFKTYELVDGRLVNVDDASDVLEMDNGKVYLTVDSKNTYQKIKLVSTDAAGNVSETEDYNVLVTANNWVQFYMNKPLFYGSIAVLVILIGGIFFIIWKRRKDEDQKKAAR